MKTLIIGLLCSLSFVLLPGCAATDGAGTASPIRKSIRAKDGLNLVCDVRGKGPTAILFLHGWCGDRQHWKNQVDQFSSNYRIITLDQAGHGESGRDRKQWSVSALAGDVETVVKALNLKRVVLVGHSMSGPVSLMAAKRMPGQVIAVIGVETLQNAEYEMPEEVSKKVLADFAADFKGTLLEMLTGMMSENADAELRNWILTRAEAQDQKMAVALMHDLALLDLKPLFTDAKVPIRCINSGGGYQLFRPTAIAINKKYADFNAVIIKDVGHYVMLEKPGEFNQKLRDLLQELAGKG